MAYSASASIDIKAPRSVVWKAITDSAQVKEWFFGTDMETTWEVGTPIYFRGQWQGNEYEDKGSIVEYKPEETTAFTYWSSMGGTADVAENYHTVRYTLSETDGITIISVEQSNVGTKESADHSTENWKTMLGKLKEYVEGKA